MTSTGRRVGVIAAWSTAAVLGLGAAASAANVAFADPTPTPSSSASAEKSEKSDRPGREFRKGRFGHGLRGAGVHGEFVVKNRDGKFVTLLSQRGEVTAVDNDSVTLKSEDGFTKEYTVNDDTRIRRDRGQSKISDVKVGDRAAVVAEKTGDGATARSVIVRTKSASD
jgi:hypothetical protein